MALSIKEKTIYLLALILSLASTYLGFSQSIKSRIFHHMYVVGPYSLAAWCSRHNSINNIININSAFSD